MVDRVSYSPDRVFYGSDLVTYDEAGVLQKSVTANLEANITSLATIKSVTANLEANILAPTAKSLSANFNALVQVLRVVVTANLDAAVGVFVIGGAAMQAWLSHTKVVTTSTGVGDLVLGAAVPTWDAFSSVLDGMEVDVFIEHESQPQNETGRYVYDHDTQTLLRNSTGVVERSTTGVGVKQSFAAGNKRVAITVNALTLLNLTLYRGSGRTIVESTDWTAGGEFQVNLSEPTHRSLVVAGPAAQAGVLQGPVLITLPPATNAEWGDEIYIEKGRGAGHLPVTVSGLSPSAVLRGQGDWLVAKVVGTTSKTWELRTRGNAEMIEDVVPAALTVDGRHVGRMLRYTGAGHTWTLNNAGRVGSVMVVNEGTGPITILNGTAAIGGVPEIPAGSKGEIVYSQQGARATVLSDKMRLTTGTSAAIPFPQGTPFSINQLMATSGPIPAAGFGIWPNSGQDETARIVTALNALMGEGPNPTLGRKRSLGFANGLYLISNLTDTTNMQVVGEHGTVFQYNGAAGAGTFMWRVQPSGANANTNFSKFRRVKFNGQSPGAGTPMPEIGVWFNTVQNWATTIVECHFFNIGLTPVRLLGASTFSAVDCRADSFGGSMFIVNEPQTRESTIAIERGSCSWLDPANIADWITQGYIPGTGSTPNYWGRAVVELQHPGSAGGGTFVSLRDFSVAWGARVGHPYSGTPGGAAATGGHAVILDRNVSTNPNRYNRILVQNLRGTADSTRQVVGFTGTLGMEPIVTAHQAAQDGGSARPIFDFTRNAAWGNAFTTSFHWTGQGLFFSENGGPMLAAASGRPPAHNSMKGETFVATDTGLESFCDGAAWVDSTAGAGVPAYQPVTATQAENGYQILRTSADVTVELVENLNNSGTFALPATGLVEGDIVRVFRTGRGTANWTNSDSALGGVLTYRHDFVQFQRSGGAWKKFELGKNPGVRRETTGKTLSASDNGSRLVATAAATYILPLNVGNATGWQVTLEQRGTNAYVTLVLDTDTGGGGINGPLTQVGSALLQTTYDGDALLVEALGGGPPQVKVSHKPVETAALATSATSLATSTTAGRPRRTTAAVLTTFHLDVTAPVGASGLLIKGPGDINVTCDGAVEYGQEGDDFSGPPLLTDDFECQGVMGWEVVAPSRYLITGQTSLALADPLDLETGDITGILQPTKGGTGVTSIQALHTALGAIGFEPLYPDLPVINTSRNVSTAHVAGVNPVDTTAGDITLTVPNGLAVPVGTQFRYLRRGVANELIIAAPGGGLVNGGVTIEVPTGAAGVARQNLSEIFLRVQGSNSYRLSGDLRTNSPTSIITPDYQISDADRGLVLRLTQTRLLVPLAANLSFGFYATVLVDSTALDFHIEGQGAGSVSYGTAVLANKIRGPDAISMWKTAAGILLVGKAATSPQLVSTNA